LGARLVRF
jgi:hypothetical protein